MASQSAPLSSQQGLWPGPVLPLSIEDAGLDTGWLCHTEPYLVKFTDFRGERST